MLKGKHIAVLSTNCLQSLGIKSMMMEYFSPESAQIFNDFNDFNEHGHSNMDFIILDSDLFIINNEFFQTIKNKLIILVEGLNNANGYQSFYSFININLSQAEIVEQFEKVILSRVRNQLTDNQEELSVREIDVLKLVAEGLINKQIADKLFISQHTVITHRKNINRKLGIKTVSGLTVYALLNGLISSDQDRA